ncbi:hypothetical protein PJP12_29755, partial [Mycobacterium kansasii]
MYYDRYAFKTYEDVANGQDVQIGNEGRSKFVGKGTVKFLFTSRNKVILTNQLPVLDMGRILNFRDLLGKPEIRVLYESGKLILFMNENFVK